MIRNCVNPACVRVLPRVCAVLTHKYTLLSTLKPLIAIISHRHAFLYICNRDRLPLLEDEMIG